MASNYQTNGSAVPFIVWDSWTESINGVDFDPIGTLHDHDNVHPTEMSEQRAEAKYAKNGFLIKPNVDGDIYCVTWEQLRDACQIKNISFTNKQTVLSGIIPHKLYGKEKEWIECAVVKVFGTDGDGTGHFQATATEIQVGLIK